MTDLGSKRVRYLRYSTEVNWQKSLPNKNWLLLLYEDNAKASYLDEVIHKTLNHNVCYVCTTGNRAEKIHDLFDEEVAYRMAENDFQPNAFHLPTHLIITTWHAELAEGVEYAIHIAEHPIIAIEEVVCLDISQGDDFKKQLKGKTDN